MSLFQLKIERTITQADKASSDYVYVPFDLPTAAKHLQVRYRYSAPISSDEAEGGNVVDIGLIDPRGADFPGGPGFRGWSGSARQEFFVSETEATPGYLPGLLPAGRYQLLLGLYRVWSRGVDCHFEIEAQLDAVGSTMTFSPSVETPKGHALPGEEDARWLCGDLQCHTFHSDAKGSPTQLLGFAEQAGLDFLAVTDHNTISHQWVLPKISTGGCLIIPGQEVTTYYGHMNVWGATEWCDFRCRTPADIRLVIDRAHRWSGVCSVNHPKPGGPPWEYGFNLPIEAMEVWQGPWARNNHSSVALWDSLLCDGYRLPAVGGSDFHCPDGAATSLSQLGQPLTWVFAKLEIQSILAAIRAGQVSMSAGPGAPRLFVAGRCGAQEAPVGSVLQRRAEDEIEIEVEVHDGAGYDLRIIVDGALHSTHALRGQVERVALSLAVTGYVRAEVVGDADPSRLPPDVPDNLDLRNWCWALSNPIYVQSFVENE